MKLKPVNQSGIHLVLMAIVLSFFLSMLGLMVTLGFLLNNKAKLQNSVNLATLGAEERFMSTSSSNYAVRADAALKRANEILSVNTLFGTGALGDLVHKGVSDANSGGELELGMYYPYEPADSRISCAQYPCYIPNRGPPSLMSPDTPANTARIRAKNKPSNPMLLPFSNILGADSLTVSSSATATIIERCTAFVLDISPSVSLQTHKFSNDIGIDLDDPGSLAFKENIIAGIESEEGPYGTCQAADHPASLNYKFFCAMPKSRQDNYDPAISHYRSDYVTVDSKQYRVRFDLYSTPEPFRTFLLAYNAGLRKLVESQSVTDKFVFIAFNKDTVDRIPTRGLTSDLSYIEQITNLNNIGKVDQSGHYRATPQRIHPNLLDRGWVSPIGGSGFTNMILSLHQAIEALSDPAFCPVTARKSIVLASDGIINCDYDRKNRSTNCNLKNYGDPRSSSNPSNTYLGAEQKLLGRTGSPTAEDNPILYDLVRSKIRVTTMISGAHVEPNFQNIVDDDGGYIDFEKAIGRGYHGLPSSRSDSQLFFNISPSITLPRGPRRGYLAGKSNFEICWEPNLKGNADACAWTYAGSVPGVTFRRAVGVMGELAFRTGGIFCPLMPTAKNSGCYLDGKLKNCCRNGAIPNCGGPEGPVDSPSTQTYALTNQGSALDAAKCVIDTLGQNPYRLLPMIEPDMP